MSTNKIDYGFNVEITQQELSDLGFGDLIKAKNFVLSHPFFYRSRAGRLLRIFYFAQTLRLAERVRFEPTVSKLLDKSCTRPNVGRYRLFDRDYPSLGNIEIFEACSRG